MTTYLAAQHLVIGSGAGGSLTAARLAEAGHDVILAEEGPAVDPGTVAPYSLEQMRRQYRHAGVTAALGRPSVAYAEGCCLGGGTEINSGLYHLAGPELLEEWRRGWKVSELEHRTLLDYALEPEQALGVQPFPVRPQQASLVLTRGARALGWDVLEVPRAFRRDSAGETPTKQTMTRTYVPRTVAAGGSVLTNTRIDRVRIRHGRATGARASGPDGKPVEISADHIWICGGAIATPSILQRSGVLRGPGRTLSMHPTVKIVARFDADLDAARDIPVHQVKEFAPDLSFGGSSSRPEHIALALADNWPASRGLLARPEGLAVYYAAIRPRAASGRVRVVPGLRDPLVTFSLGRADLALLASGLRRLAHLLLVAGARSLHPSLPNTAAVRSSHDIARLPSILSRSDRLMTVHLFSSVPMGEDAACCPVDSYGRVRAVAGLRVNDASLLPSAPGINPQGTIMALAARNCAQFLAEGR
jgi:choline dehydrogenase-like flavoprotein